MTEPSDTSTYMNRILSKKVRFWFPITATYEDADYSVELKAPEEDNTSKVGRNQSIVRTRAGRTIVYDRGNNLNTTMELKFKDILDADRSSLMVFLAAVQWASSKIVYQDMYGDVYYVRALEESGITYIDRGLLDKTNRRKASTILWNFDLDLLDISDNIEEIDEEDPPVSDALSLHLADYDEPHNPTICTTLDIADGAKVIESFSTTDWKAVIWLVVATKDDRKAVFTVSCTHDRDGGTDATTTATPVVETQNDIGLMSAILTITSDLNGAAASQVMRLKIATSEDGIQVCVKRVKI
jgi:hypothetical protein